MDQFFAAFGIDWRLLIIQGVNFAVLLGALTYFLYKPMMKVIDERRAKIAEGVQLAQAASAELASAKEEKEALIGEGAREAESLVASARLRADEKGAEIKRTAEQQAEALLQDAQARAGEVRRKVLAESERDVARAAMLAAEKIMRSGSSMA